MSGSGIQLQQLHSTVSEMLANKTLSHRPILNPMTMKILAAPEHLGFMNSLKIETSKMTRPHAVGMVSIALMALCSTGYEINHITVIGISREAMIKLWNIMSSKCSDAIAEDYRRIVMMNRSSLHYMQLFKNLPTPKSMRTSKDDSARTDARNEHMKDHYDGTLATIIDGVDWDNVTWDFTSEPGVHSCVEVMDYNGMVMVEQATGVEQARWQLPEDHA